MRSTQHDATVRLYFLDRETEGGAAETGGAKPPGLGKGSADETSRASTHALLPSSNRQR